MKTKNNLGYDVLDPSYLEKLMGKGLTPKELDPWDEEVLRNQLGELPKVETLNKEFKLPELLGDNIAEHFEVMAKEVTKTPKTYIKAILKRAKIDNLPKLDESTVNFMIDHLKPHTDSKPWLKLYLDSDDNLSFENLELPDSNWLIADTETFVKGSRQDSPIIATAIGQDPTGTMSMYIWVHSQLLYPNDSEPFESVLVPVGTKKLIICHNIAFDGALFKERYSLDTFSNYLMCTQAMNQAVSGLDSSQRWALNVKENKPYFLNFGCGNSLMASYKFHTGKEVPPGAKDPRKLFVEADKISQIGDRLFDCLQYAIQDVVYTLELFQVLYPKYRKVIKSDVCLAGHMMLANSVIPVRNDWYKWAKGVEQTYQKAQEDINQLLNVIADEYHEAWQKGELDTESDPWLSHLDWSRASDKEDHPLYNVASWYSDKVIHNKPLSIGGKTELAHYLLKLTWLGKPLFKSKVIGWAFVNDEGEEEKVPHYKGTGENVGTLLSSNYLEYFENGTLNSNSEKAKQVAELIKLCSYWLGMRNRVLAVRAVPIENPVDGSKMTLVAPRVNPHGTASGRTTDPIFVVLAAHTGKKYGSELKSLSYSGSSHRFVGYDFKR